MKVCEFTPILDDTLPHCMVWGGDNEPSCRGTEGEREGGRKRNRQIETEQTKDII